MFGIIGVLALLAGTVIGQVSGLRLQFVGLLIFTLIISHLIKNIVDLKKVPTCIRIAGENLVIDTKTTHRKIIQRIELTMKINQEQNYSQNETRWYMKIYTNKKKFTYWLGSDKSFSEDKYEMMCQGIMSLFADMPEKILRV